MKKLRCVLYARVSTRKERGLQNPETQLRQLREFATTQNWEVTGEYIDHERGTKADRPEFLYMMEAASKREFDVPLFWSIDRFSREGIVPVLTNLKRLSGYGVRYPNYQESFIDTTASEFGILAVLGGLRRGELEALRWQDNSKPGTVVVDEAVYRRKIGTPKTFKSRREVSIGPGTQQAMNEWALKGRFTGAEDFVFAIRTATPIDLHNAVARHVKAACRKLASITQPR